MRYGQRKIIVPSIGYGKRSVLDQYFDDISVSRIESEEEGWNSIRDKQISGIKGIDIQKHKKTILPKQRYRKITPENERLCPYYDSLSPVFNNLSLEDKQDLSTISNNSGDTGDTGDKSGYIIENTFRKDNDISDIKINKKCNCSTLQTFE